MPHFTVRTTYVTDREKLQRVRPAHREYLVGLAEAGKVLAAGPWADDLGGFIVYAADDEAQFHELLAQDPYVREEVLSEVVVREWKPLLGQWVR